MKALRPKPEICLCSKCTLRDEQFVKPWILPRAQFPLLWVGQNPGTTEGSTNIPFTGSSGKLLYRLMMSNGLQKNKQNITNLVCCLTPEDREPTDLEVSCCAPLLKQVIEQTQPKLIISMGAPTMKALTGHRSGLTKFHRGQFYPLLSKWAYACQVLVCLHPAFVSRQRQWIDTATNDFKLALDYIEDLDEPKAIKIVRDEPNFNLSPTSADLQDYLSRSDVNTSFDIETTDLNPRTSAITGISFCNSPSDAIVVGWNDPRFADTIKHFLEDPTALKSTQNGSFDCEFLEYNSISVRGLSYDTRLAEHLLNSDLPTDLQFLRKQYTKYPAYKRKRSKRDFVSGKGVSDLECAWDSFVTHAVMQAQLPLLSTAHKRVLNDIYMPLVFTLNRMQMRGLLVDIVMLAHLHSQIKPKMDEIERLNFRPLGLNPRSPKQLLSHFNRHGLSVRKLDSTDKDALKVCIKAGHPDKLLMAALREYKDLHTADSKFLMGIHKRLENGRIHTHYHPEGTGTGRISSRGPNLQNPPKLFRIIYIPDDSDHVFVESDYNQLELVVAALLGREVGLLEQIAKGIKPHHVLGKVIFGRDWDQLTDQEKLREKAVLFGTIGGRSAHSIAREFGIPVYTAESWQNACVSQYPGLGRYQDECINEFRTTGKITTAYGTERRVNDLPQAMNNKMQGSASFVTLSTLNELDKAGFDLRTTIHDSICWQCRRTEVEESIRLGQSIIERPIEEFDGYKFKSKVKFGDNWYQMEEAK